MQPTVETCQLLLVRHGLSEWNQSNQFTGWVDVDLAPQGVTQAQVVAQQIQEMDWHFDIGFTSMLKRAIKTLWIICETMNYVALPVIKHFALNERHYGALQGLNKQEMMDKYGKQQVHEWRRSYEGMPPKLPKMSDQEYSDFHYYYPDIINLYRQQGLVELPRHENLCVTQKRVVDFFQHQIYPKIQEGYRVIIVAHGNSLRSLIKFLENIPDDQIDKFDLSTGEAVYYHFPHLKSNQQEKQLAVRLAVK